MTGLWVCLEYADGTPFFSSPTPAWQLRSLSEADIDAYLKDRAEKHFNVVMADFRAGMNNPTDQSAEAMGWKKNDFIVDRAAKHGLYVVVIAGWGSSFKNWPAEKMHAYGRQLGERYRDRPNVIFFVAAEFYKIRQRLDGKPLEPSRREALEPLGLGLRARIPDI